MKTIGKLMLSAAVSAFVFTAANATEVTALNDGPNAGELTKAPAPAANAELPVVIKNTAATNIYIFAGPKEDIRTPKVQTYGGYSKNTIYVQVNDVVCLMTSEVKPMACTVIKPGTSNIEVNTSGTGIATK